MWPRLWPLLTYICVAYLLLFTVFLHAKFEPYKLAFAIWEIFIESVNLKYRSRKPRVSSFSLSGDRPMRFQYLKNLGAVCHLGYDRKYILTITQLLWSDIIPGLTKKKLIKVSEKSEILAQYANARLSYYRFNKFRVLGCPHCSLVISRVGWTGLPQIFRNDRLFIKIRAFNACLRFATGCSLSKRGWPKCEFEGDPSANFVKNWGLFFLHFTPVKIKGGVHEKWSLSRYFKHGLGPNRPNILNAFDCRAARQAGNIPHLSRLMSRGPNFYRVDLGLEDRALRYPGGVIGHTL